MLGRGSIFLESAFRGVGGFDLLRDLINRNDCQSQTAQVYNGVKPMMATVPFKNAFKQVYDAAAGSIFKGLPKTSELLKGDAAYDFLAILKQIFWVYIAIGSEKRPPPPLELDIVGVHFLPAICECANLLMQDIPDTSEGQAVLIQDVTTTLATLQRAIDSCGADLNGQDDDVILTSAKSMLIALKRGRDQVQISIRDYVQNFLEQ